MSDERQGLTSERRVQGDEPDSLLATHDSPLVIGYGNPLRTDDGVGWQVAQQLATDLADDVDVIGTHQLTPELAEPISRAGLVVFVDAGVGGEPGHVGCRLIAPAGDGTMAFSHD